MNIIKKLGITPGPWRWEINLRQKCISICGGNIPFDLTVMDFIRWGVQSAMPRFITDNWGHGATMTDSKELTKIVKGREHHKSWFQTIDNPDANLIATAPEMLEALIGLMKGVNKLPPLTAIQGVLTKEWDVCIELLKSRFNLTDEEIKELTNE